MTWVFGIRSLSSLLYAQVKPGAQQQDHVLLSPTVLQYTYCINRKSSFVHRTILLLKYGYRRGEICKTNHHCDNRQTASRKTFKSFFSISTTHASNDPNCTSTLHRSIASWKDRENWLHVEGHQWHYGHWPWGNLLSVDMVVGWRCCHADQHETVFGLIQTT